MSNLTEKPWHTCSASGKKFQTPNGAQCVSCKNWFHAKYYIYVDMEPTCLRCRKDQIKKIFQAMTPKKKNK